MPAHFRRWTCCLLAAVFSVAVNAWAAPSPKNILLVVADDIGTDALSLFNTNTGPHVSSPPTPMINSLAQRGVLFRNAYAFPSCSPTRASMLTGRYGFRTGLGAAIGFAGDPLLSPREFTIPKALDRNSQLGFRHANIGKWHCSTNALDPNIVGGWSHYSGFIGADPSSHYAWQKTVNGATALNTNWLTSDVTTDAINWIQAQGTNRWFLWFAPKAAHSPFEAPPANLHSQSLTPTSSDREKYVAMIEALDREMGRLLTDVNLAETMVVFCSDNGTPHEVIQAPFDENHAKGSLTEGGTRIPLIIAGAGVVGTNRTSSAVVHATDLFATLLEFAGVNMATTLPTNLVFDSRSFAAVLRDEPWTPAEPLILLENFGTIIPPELQGVAVRGQRYKLVKLDIGRQEFYDLQNDPFETNSLLGTPANLNNLTPAERMVYAGFTNQLAQWHNPPQAPTITKWEKSGGTFTLTVPEQLGITYDVVAANAVTATNWTALQNFVRAVNTNAAEVTLSAPAFPAARFYRVAASGR